MWLKKKKELVFITFKTIRVTTGCSLNEWMMNTLNEDNAHGLGKCPY